MYELRLYFTIAWNGEKEIVAFIGSLQAAIASFISVFTAVWNIKGKLKEKLKYVYYLLFPGLTPNVFLFQNLTSWTWMSLLKSLYVYKMFIVINSNVHDLKKHKYIAFNNIITHASYKSSLLRQPEIKLSVSI